MNQIHEFTYLLRQSTQNIWMSLMFHPQDKRKDVFRYLMEDVEDSSSENNI